MHKSNINKEIQKTWNKYSKDFGLQDDKRENINDLILDTHQDNAKDAEELLSFWFILLDQGLQTLLLLDSCIKESTENNLGKPTIAFPSLVSRTCLLTVAIRTLVKSGLDLAARPIARSLLETIDLAIVTLIDEDFGNKYFPDDLAAENHENLFWKQNIAWGKIDKKIEKHILQLGLNCENEQLFQWIREVGKESFSKDIHSSATSAFLSMLIPSLKSPGLLSRSVIGHVSIYSPELLSWVILLIYCFMGIVIKTIMKDDVALTIQGIEFTTSSQNLFVAFFAYQEVVCNHLEDLPPKSEFPDIE